MLPEHALLHHPPRPTGGRGLLRRLEQEEHAEEASPTGGASSAGWNKRSTRPGSSSLISSSNHPAPTSIAVWASCPQACITPSTFETKECSFSSCMGNASRSALRATVLPGLPPSTTPSTPVSA